MKAYGKIEYQGRNYIRVFEDGNYRDYRVSQLDIYEATEQGYEIMFKKEGNDVVWYFLHHECGDYIAVFMGWL